MSVGDKPGRHKGRANADEALALGVAAGKTVRDAAAEAGVSESTAHRRLTDPVFAARVQEIRDGLVSAAAGRLAGGMAAAADVLVALLQSQDENVKLRAASQLLAGGVKVVEVAELQRRLEALERVTSEARR